MKKEPFSNKNLFFKSITFRLTIIVALIVLFFGSIGIVIATNSVKQKITKVIQKQLFTFAEYISDHIDTEMNKGLYFFTDLADDFSKEHLKSDIRSGTKWLEKRLVPPIFKYGVILISPDGERLIAEYPILPGRKELSFAQKKWFQRAKTANKAIFSKPFKNRITLEPSIVFAAPIKNDKNKLIAVVAGLVGLNQPELFRQLYSSPMGSGSGLLVISPEDKLFVASNIPEMVLTPTPEPGRNKLHDMAMNGYRGVGVTVNAHGVEELSAIADVKSTGWFVVVRLPVAKAYLPVKQLSKSLILYNVLLTAMVVLFLVVALVTVLSPLKKAAWSVKQMASGEQLLSKFPVVYSDEVGDLTDGFNNLIDRIEERTTKLESAKRELENANKELERIANVDGLTQLANRRYFDVFFNIEWERAKREKYQIAIIFCDIDFFKKYNDTYGHQTGDDCLKLVAQAIGSASKRPADLSARYGGEEFIVVLSKTDLDGAIKVAKNIHENVKKLSIYHSTSEVSKYVSVSVGVSCTVPSNLRDKENLIKEADQALYEAKRKGRDMIFASDKAV